MQWKLFDPRLWITAVGGGANVLQVGASVPEFEATAHDGSVVRSRDFADKKYIVWFYPAASTPGCTAQGCGFRDRYEDYRAQGIEVFGVSFDSVEENRTFAEKHRFPYRLLSDTNRSMGVAFGVVADKAAPYAHRIAFAVEQGKITHVYDVKNVSAHAGQVLNDIGRS